MTVAPCPHCAASAWERTESATKPKSIEQPVKGKSNKGGSEAHRISSLCFPGPGIATRQNGSIPAKTTNLYQARTISSIVSRSLFPRGPVLSAPPTAVIAPNHLSVCGAKPTHPKHRRVPATRHHLVICGGVRSLDITLCPLTMATWASWRVCALNELRLCPAMLPPISRQVPFPCAEYNTQTI